MVLLTLSNEHESWKFMSGGCICRKTYFPESFFARLAKGHVSFYHYLMSVFCQLTFFLFLIGWFLKRSLLWNNKAKWNKTCKGKEVLHKESSFHPDRTANMVHVQSSGLHDPSLGRQHDCEYSTLLITWNQLHKI